MSLRRPEPNTDADAEELARVVRYEDVRRLDEHIDQAVYGLLKARGAQNFDWMAATAARMFRLAVLGQLLDAEGAGSSDLARDLSCLHSRLRRAAC